MAEDHLPRSWLTGEVRMDPFLLDDAARAYADRGGGEDGYLAARQLLDERLRRSVHWPRGLDYAQIADDLAAVGKSGEAMLLRRVAATDGLLSEAQARWNDRYSSRAETSAERDARRLIDAGLIDFDPDGPYPGIDGSLYWPGYTVLEAGAVQVPVVAVSGRGMRELVTGFDSDAAVARWLHDRGPMASGPLVLPDVPSLPRAVLEEHVLARMLRRRDLPELTEPLPATTFTADARYDIYTAIAYVAGRGQPWDTPHVASELGHRMNWVPEWARARYGGQNGPWAQAYLRRLAVTDPITYAVPRLIADDTSAELRVGGGAHATPRPGETVAHARPAPEIGRWQRIATSPAEQAPLARRPPEPGPQAPKPRL